MQRWQKRPEAPPCKKLCPCGTDLLTLSEYHIKQLSGSKHKRLTARDGTKTLKAFFSALLSSPPSGRAVAESEQEKELDKDAGTFQEVMDQTEVADNEQSEEDDNVVDAQSDVERNADFFSEGGPWEGQVVGEREIVELNNDTSYRCCGYKVNVPEPFTLNYPFQLHALMKLPFTFSENALFSDSCSGTVHVSGEACGACQMLPHTKVVQQIESRAHVADTHTNYHFLTYNQLHEHVETLRKECSELWFTSLNQGRKLSHIAKSLEAHKRLILSLSENDLYMLLLVTCLDDLVEVSQSVSG